jgi:hypothetical protein
MRLIGKKVRNLLFVFFILIVFRSPELFSQILIGPKGGLNLGVLSVENQIPDASNSFRAGILLGGAIEIRLSDILSIQAEPAYIQKGSLISFYNGIQQVDTKIHLGYLQLPFSMKIRLPDHSVTPFAFIGPNIGILLSEKTESNLTYPVFTDYYKNTDYAIDVGVGFEYNISPLTIFTTDVRYSLGVYNIDNTNIGAVRTRGIQLLVGVLFLL